MLAVGFERTKLAFVGCKWLPPTVLTTTWAAFLPAISQPGRYAATRQMDLAPHAHVAGVLSGAITLAWQASIGQLQSIDILTRFVDNASHAASNNPIPIGNPNELGRFFSQV